MNSSDRLLPVEFERIIEALNRRKVRYVVIGALAALLQGVPLPRSMDVDITPAGDEANRKRLAAALRDLQARLRAPGLDDPVEIPPDERTFTGMMTMTFVTEFGPFDVCFVPDGTTGYDDLARSALTIDSFGVAIPVCSVEDIIRSKEAAGREKDAAHLPILLDFLEGKTP